MDIAAERFPVVPARDLGDRDAHRIRRIFFAELRRELGIDVPELSSVGREDAEGFGVILHGDGAENHIVASLAFREDRLAGAPVIILERDADDL